jgi:hypothetical protein
MKKNLTIILIIVAVILIVSGIFLIKGKDKNQKTNENQQDQKKTLETPLEDRPYVVLIPRADGNEFTLEISRIKNAKTIEYELVYESQGLSRGVIGSVEISSGETEVSRKLLLGSCSKDVCKYDEGVEQGSLTLRFRGAEGTRKFETSFHLQQGDKELTTVDESFKLAGKFAATTFYLTMPTIGLPEKTENKVIAGPFGVFTAGSTTAKGSALSLVLSESPSSSKLFLFDGGKSTEQSGAKTEGQNLTAAVDSLGTFFVTE